ncbi:uncharacterized protein LOC126335930 [Schistocerca gregaria]|uniref:uncharacterized protein LOC126335930 n=1 Tax=Schistocerca gregaria TaxID=7010 RepID=UPI00211DE470|nr:uncharacterized protein LOC126335930 [Schistocerca gregaria]
MNVLSEHNLQESNMVPCMFYDEKLVLLFYVDDGLAMCSTDATAKFIEELGKRFQISVEKVDYFLAIQIKRFDNCIQTHQSAYVKRILEKYDVMDAKPLSLPIKPGESPPFNNTGLYRDMVGSLMYLTQGTRPDLSFAVNVASRVQDSPTHAQV